MKKPPRGGKREGAGRKPIADTPTRSRSITLTEADIAFLKTIAKNLSAAIRELIRKAQDRDNAERQNNNRD